MSRVTDPSDGVLIDMKVSSLAVDPFTNMPIVILKDHEGRQAVPIWVGLVEASAIATELENIRLDRPMTHDLMKTILCRCGVRLARVEVHDLRDNTFYATMFLERPDGAVIGLDARPSDAIALALRTGACIRVARRVIDKVRSIDMRADPPSMPACRAVGRGEGDGRDDDGLAADPERSRELLAALGDSAFGKWKM